MPLAARLTDPHVCPMVTGIVPHVGGPVVAIGALTVLIGGMPAARVGDTCVCVGPPDAIVKGSLGVFIGGPQAARMGDNTAHGGVIVMGHPTVIIGDGGIGGGGGSSSASAGTGKTVNLAEVQPGELKAPDKQAGILKQAAKKGTPFVQECPAAA